MAALSDLTEGIGSRIGGYFSLVSALPSSLFTIFAYALLESGVPGQPPDWHASFRALTTLGLGEIAALTVVAVSLGLALHPLQFTFVQLMEGYWGTSMAAIRLRTWRTRHLRDRQRALLVAWEDAEGAIEEDDDADRTVLDLTERIRTLAIRDECDRLLAGFPHEADHVMPTRLGNVLRRYEVAAGSSYGLDAPSVLPHLGLVADPAHVAYLNDQRTLLDLSVRLSMLCFLASALLTATLWLYGLWLLLAVVAYLLAYLCYRGAVRAAHAYGSAIAAVVDLNRFALYERLHVAPPRDSASERNGPAAYVGALTAFHRKLPYQKYVTPPAAK